MAKTAPTRMRVTRYLAGPALALGLAIGSATVANAEAVWDIEAYDNCMAGLPTILTPAQYNNAERDCCIKSGGVHDMWKCGAPGVESRGGAPTHVMQPSPLPGPPTDIGSAPGGGLTSSP